MFVENAIRSIVREVDRANGARSKRVLEVERAVELVQRVRERGGWEFAHAGRSGNGGTDTTSVFAAAVDGRVYFGAGEANAAHPSPKKVHAYLSGIGAKKLKAETADRKLRAWVESGEAILVAEAKEPEWMTVAEFARERGLDLTDEQLWEFDRRAAELCRQRGIRPRQVFVGEGV